MAKTSGDDFTSHLAVTLSRRLRAAGVIGRQAEEIVLDLMADLRANLGGSTLYFPKGRPDAEELAAEIFAQWSAGKAIADICTDKRFTAQYVYRLLARERARLAGIRESHKPTNQSEKRDGWTGTLE